MAAEATNPIERWTATRRVALVVSILKGATSVAEAARMHGLTVAEVEDWREKFLLGAENALRSRPRDEEALNGNSSATSLPSGVERRRRSERSKRPVSSASGHSGPSVPRSSAVTMG
ncbi:MAG: hypothetical protein K0S58_1677, partial [Nitrospira sp.]|jgi:transposase-like protein|nr:hypothetical protein [Nitrospira sp.]